LSQRQSPIEAGIGWAVGFKSRPIFIGKPRTDQGEDRPVGHILVGIEIEGRKPAPGAFLYADRAAKHMRSALDSALWSPT